jgi:uncharacterized repeat protein (TIGR01451 family)
MLLLLLLINMVNSERFPTSSSYSGTGNGGYTQNYGGITSPGITIPAFSIVWTIQGPLANATGGTTTNDGLSGTVSNGIALAQQRGSSATMFNPSVADGNLLLGFVTLAGGCLCNSTGVECSSSPTGKGQITMAPSKPVKNLKLHIYALGAGGDSSNVSHFHSYFTPLSLPCNGTESSGSKNINCTGSKIDTITLKPYLQCNITPPNYDSTAGCGSIYFNGLIGTGSSIPNLTMGVGIKSTCSPASVVPNGYGDHYYLMASVDDHVINALPDSFIVPIQNGAVFYPLSNDLINSGYTITSTIFISSTMTYVGCIPSGGFAVSTPKTIIKTSPAGPTILTISSDNTSITFTPSTLNFNPCTMTGITYQITDSFGATAQSTINLTFVRPNPTVDVPINNSYYFTRPIYSGTGFPGTPVSVYVDGVVACSATPPNTRIWSCTGSLVPNGTHTIYASQTFSGNTNTSLTSTFYIVYSEVNILKTALYNDTNNNNKQDSGDRIIYNVTLRNIGTSNLTNISVTDSMPSFLGSNNVISYSGIGSSPLSCSSVFVIPGNYSTPTYANQPSTIIYPNQTVYCVYYTNITQQDMDL